MLIQLNNYYYYNASSQLNSLSQSSTLFHDYVCMLCNSEIMLNKPKNEQTLNFHLLPLFCMTLNWVPCAKCFVWSDLAGDPPAALTFCQSNLTFLYRLNLLNSFLNLPIMFCNIFFSNSLNYVSSYFVTVYGHLYQLYVLINLFASRCW